MKTVIAPQLSVIVPCLHPGPSLERLLRSLRSCSANFAYEILVIFNLPSPLGEKIAEQFGAESFTVGSIGVNAARNLGIEKSRAPIVLFLDDDCAIDDHRLLEHHRRLHQELPDATAIGGIYTCPGDTNAVQRCYNEMARAWVAQARFDDQLQFDLLGGHVSYKKALLPGGMKFDPTILFGGSETEYHLRLVRRGCQLVFRPDLEVVHYTSNSLLGLARKAFLQGRTFRDLPLAHAQTQAPPTSPRSWRNPAWIYHYAFALGLNGLGQPPESWFGISRLILGDGLRRIGNGFQTLVNSRPMTNANLLLRLALHPRRLGEDN